MVSKLSVIVFLCFSFISFEVKADTAEDIVTVVAYEQPDKRFGLSDITRPTHMDLRVPYVTSRGFVARILVTVLAYVNGSQDPTSYHGRPIFYYYPNGTTNGLYLYLSDLARTYNGVKDQIGIYFDGSTTNNIVDFSCEVWHLRSIKAKNSSITVKYGTQGAVLQSWDYFDRMHVLDDYINPRMLNPEALTTIPAGVTATSSGISIPAGTTGDFQYKIKATDDILNPALAEVTVSFLYDAAFSDEPTAFSDKWEVGDKVKTKDNRNATILNEAGDVMTDSGAIVGIKNPNNPFYDSSKNTATGTQTTSKPTESTETTTTKPEYTGENAETGAIVNAVGDVGQGFTESVNNLSSDVTNGLNGLGEGNAEGFNNLVNAISNLNNDANQNSSQERDKLDGINESLETIAESIAGEEGQEPDDVTISDETTNAPSFTGVLSSIAGLNVAPASPPVFNISLPRLGGLSPQLLTLDFASIPFLHYFPLVRSILAWSLIIFTFKHIFQIFTLGG